MSSSSSSPSFSSSSGPSKESIIGFLLCRQDQNIEKIPSSFTEINYVWAKDYDLLKDHFFFPHVDMTSETQMAEAISIFVNQVKKIFSVEQEFKSQRKDSCSAKTLSDLIAQYSLQVLSQCIENIVLSLCVCDPRLFTENFHKVRDHLRGEESKGSQFANADTKETEKVIEALESTKDTLISRNPWDDWDIQMVDRYTISNSLMPFVYRAVKTKVCPSFLGDRDTFTALFQVIRLLEVLCVKYSGIVYQSNEFLVQFKKTISSRSKFATPHCTLGMVFVKLLVSTNKEGDFDTFLPVLLDELFARNSLWSLREFPELSSKRISKCYRNTKAFQGAQTSYRLVLLFYHLYGLVEEGKPARPRSKPVIQSDEERKNAQVTMDRRVESSLSFYSALWTEMTDFRKWFEKLNVACPDSLSERLLRSQEIAVTEKHYVKHKKFFVAERDGDAISRLPKCVCEQSPCIWE